MSDQTPQANPLPNPEQAYNHLFDTVHGQVFFGKLAEAGFAPTTQKEAQDMLELAGKLRLAEEDPQVKQAAAAASPLSQAANALDGVLTQNGMDGQLKQAAAVEQDTALKQAVGHLLQDRDVYNSVLALKAAEAEQIAADIGLTQPQEAAPAQG
jgi:hypothetical protein